jgi:hypothetical protein
MTCRKCIHYSECADKNGETKYYGNEFAANNVEKLCPLYAAFGAAIPNRFIMRFMHKDIVQICRDVNTIFERYPEYKIVSTNMIEYNGEICVLVFFEREAENDQRRN